MSFPLPVIDVSGDPHEMGLRYGAEAGELIRENVAAYLRRFERMVGLDRPAVLAAGAPYEATTMRHFPRLAAMLAGVATGADVDLALLYAINARSELLYGTATCGSPAAAEAGECTSLGVLDTHAANGHTLLAQNWDWHPDQLPYTLLLITRDELGHQVATLTEAGMLAKTGLNAHGLGVCVNLIGCDRDGTPGGVPYHLLLRSALEADSLSWATRNVIRAPRSASINLLLGQSHGDGGELLDLELCPGDVGWLSAEDGILIHANHFESGLPVYDTIKDWGGSSLFRASRARRLLKQFDGKLTPDHLLTVLKDHHSAPLSICRHLDQRDQEVDRSLTIWTVLMDLTERSITLIPGPPCQGGDGMVLKPFN